MSVKHKKILTLKVGENIEYIKRLLDNIVDISDVTVEPFAIFDILVSIIDLINKLKKMVTCKDTTP